jgi:hypothetical protein
VALESLVTGVLDVTVNFSLPVDAATTELEMPRIQTDAPEGYRAILAVQNFSRHELSVAEDTALQPVGAAEQAGLLPEQIRGNLQVIEQAFRPHWRLRLSVRAAKQAARVQAVIDLMAITTAIDRDGRCRYQVVCDLQNRSEQFLRLALPAELSLWSATVAGQPVKPVADADAASDEVLIPLVKTSPGGLPYKVVLYLAGRTAFRPEAMGELAPPRIAIRGMTVVRTSWSLRLPPGYQYRQSGGNMSSAAATAQMLTLATDALIDQSKRMEASVEEADSQWSRLIAIENLDRLNKKLLSDNGRNWYAINERGGEIDKETLSRLQSQVEGQQAYQRQLEGRLRGLRSSEEPLTKEGKGIVIEDVNVLLNNEIANPGTFENARNATLAQVPEFVEEAARRQAEAIQKDIQEAGKRLNESINKLEMSEDGRRGDPDRPSTGGRITLDEDAKRRKLDAAQMELADKQAEQAQKAQIELEKQLADVTGNRAGRYYQGNVGQGKDGRWTYNVPASRPAGMPAGPGGPPENTWYYESSPTQPFVTDLPAPPPPPSGMEGEDVVLLPRTYRPGQAGQQGQAEFSRQIWGQTERITGDEAAGDDLDMTTGFASPYVAGGTFSLPMELPEGGVQLDFVHNSGDGEIRLWAVQTELLDRLRATGMLMAVVVGLAMGVQVARRRASGSRGRVAGYVVLAAVLAALGVLLGGPIGAVVAAGLILLAEVARRALGRRA